MKEDLKKFMELVKTDETLQKKLEEAAKTYDGEQTEEAVFAATILPVAKEAGFSITFDDVRHFSQELDLDEMSQVSGGGVGGGGVGAIGCESVGFGWGWTAAVVGDVDISNVRGAFCIIVGGGGRICALCLAYGNID